MKRRKGPNRDDAEPEPHENWDDLLEQHGQGKLRRIDWARIGEERSAPDVTADETDAGIVIFVASGRCRVFRNGEEIDCIVPSAMAVRQKSLLTVGDRVLIENESGTWRVETVLPRRSILARPDPLDPRRQRLIAANIDVVIHVVAVKAPPLRPRLIDRVLIAIQRGGADPVLCVNKIDLLSDDARAVELAKVEPYRALGVPVIPCSATTGEGLDPLREAVQGKTSALVGHSGVGKSSILNALDMRLQLATRDLHKRGTGRHTTTAATLYDFGEGTYLIDTPGVREFGLWSLDRQSLREYFPEFQEPSEFCRFNDCAHVPEPDCEVKRRVEAGTINRGRYETYVRLYEDSPS